VASDQSAAQTPVQAVVVNDRDIELAQEALVEWGILDPQQSDRDVLCLMVARKIAQRRAACLTELYALRPAPEPGEALDAYCSRMVAELGTTDPSLRIALTSAGMLAISRFLNEIETPAFVWRVSDFTGESSERVRGIVASIRRESSTKAR